MAVLLSSGIKPIEPGIKLNSRKSGVQNICHPYRNTTCSVIGNLSVDRKIRIPKLFFSTIGKIYFYFFRWHIFFKQFFKESLNPLHLLRAKLTI